MILILIVCLAIAGLLYSALSVQKDHFRKEESIDLEGIEEIEINNNSWDVELKHTESKQISIVAEGRQKEKESDPVTIKSKGNKIVVNQSDEKGFLQGFSFRKSGKISISVPDNEIETITLSNNNGDIEVKNIVANNLVVLNDSGSETITGLSVDNGKFTLKDGQLKLNNSSLKELIVDSEAGDSYITNVTSPNMEITSKDGEVWVKDATEEESLFVTSTSGDITVSYKEVPASLLLTTYSDSADITVELDHMKEIKNTEKAKEWKIGEALNKVKLLSKDGVISVKYID